MRIRIYQINSLKDAVKEDSHRNIFREYDPKHFSKDIYDLVFEGHVDASSLGDVFEIFNIRHPEGYTGRSLSVSDIVEIITSESVPKGLYYCQSVGWLPITVN